MRLFGLFALILFALVAVGQLLITLTVEQAERQRRLRNPVRLRNEFRPVVIRGGKAQAPPKDADETPESRIA